MKTRFPHTVILLRCQDETLSSREGRDWVEHSCVLVAAGQVECLRPHLASMQSYLWLRMDDPR